MAYAFPTWEVEADIHAITFQHLHKNKIILTMGNFPRHTPVWNFGTNVHGKKCRQQTEVLKNY
jgi:hypothetical protein